MRLAQHPVGEQTDLGAKQRPCRDLEVGGVQGVSVLRDVPDKPTRRGKPQLADAVLSRQCPQFVTTASFAIAPGQSRQPLTMSFMASVSAAWSNGP